MLGVLYQDTIIGYTSGIIWDENGYILTNDHLIPADKNPEDVQTLVMFAGLKKSGTYEATVETRLFPAYGDLLLLKLKDAPDFLRGFKPPHLARDVALTETVYIIGNPGTDQGIIPSSITKTQVINAASDGEWLIMEVRAIGGQSGSGVWNENGELIGLAEARYTETGEGSKAGC